MENYEEILPEKSPEQLAKEELIERALIEESEGFNAVLSKKTILIRTREIPTCWWLAKEIKIHPGDLTQILRLIRKSRNCLCNCLYKVVYLPKENGDKREICVPDERLKKIQRKINKYILSYLNPAKNVFGFSGGSINDAINPHLEAKSILCVDFEDAFPSITSDDVFQYLIEGRKVYLRTKNQHPVFFGPDETIKQKRYHYEYGYFSWYGAKIITQLTTFKKKLPQGAPTSPRLFDLICKKLDKELLSLIENVKGKYTRYADNLFFSTEKEKFPRKTKITLLRTIRKYGFEPHKIKEKKIEEKSALRMLGLNLIKGKAHNTRKFKRQLRLSLHHLGWLLDHGLAYEEAWQKVRGQIGFARIDTLPRELLENYLKLEKRIS